MCIGIGAVDIWLNELHDFLKESGVRIGVITRETLKSGLIFSRFSFNKKSFIDNNLFFTIKRKQDRIKKYIELFPGSTTIRGLSRTEENCAKISAFAQTRPRIGGRFIKMDNEIV